MMRTVPRVALLLPTATYRAPDFLNAAANLGVEVVVASEQAQALAGEMGDRAVLISFDDPERAADALVAAGQARALDAVVAVDEPGVLPAALAAERLGLPHNPPAAVAATRDKASLRRHLAAAGVPQPAFTVVHPGDDVAAAAREIGLPCVVKPVSLSASRGVIRADSPEEAVTAAERVRALLRAVAAGEAGAAPDPPDPDGPLLVEAYAPGAEVAVEGLLTGGALDVLAVFDKPDPMEGPYFAETLLVTPSRLPEAALQELARVTAAAATALGLVEGPVHAEARVDAAGGGDPEVRVLELAARSIGGHCSRTLRFGTDMSLEELILRHAARLPVSPVEREEAAAGVAMLYAPRAGTFQRVDGREAAEAIPGIVEVEITAASGAVVAPIPESARYLGFVFARGPEPAEVEAALRAAVDRLDIVVGDADPGDAPHSEATSR